MSTDVFPFAVWQSGTNENSIPANDNALRNEVLAKAALGVADSEPVGPAERDMYVVGTAWGAFATDDVVIYINGTWYGFKPFDGWAKVIGGDLNIYSSVDGWVIVVSSGPVRAPAIQSVVSAATVTPTFSDDMVKITAQATGLTLANPTGTPIPGLGMVIRIKDNGTARSIAYGTQYRAIGITLPTTTVANKTLYIAMIYNSDDTRWDCIATGREA